jgi:hypothetical protein
MCGAHWRPHGPVTIGYLDKPLGDWPVRDAAAEELSGCPRE